MTSKELYCAAKAGNLALVQQLLKDAHVDPNHHEIFEKEQTPLIIASRLGRVDVVKLLLNDPRVRVNELQRWDAPALMVACQEGHVEVVKLLLEKKEIDLNVKNAHRISSIQQAAVFGNAPIIKLTLKDPRLDRKSLNWTLLHVACATQDLDLFYRIICQRERRERRMEATAARTKKGVNEKEDLEEAQVEELDEKKAGINLEDNNDGDDGDLIDFNQKDSSGFTAFHYLTGTKCVQIVKALISLPDLDLNTTDNTFSTPLYDASEKGNWEIVNWILSSDKYVNVDITSTWGRTASTAATEEKHFKIANLLERYAFNPILVREEARKEIRYYEMRAHELMALIILYCDEYLKFVSTKQNHRKQTLILLKNVKRLFKLAQKLPMEIQMHICYLTFNSTAAVMSSSLFDNALFEILAKFQG